MNHLNTSQVLKEYGGSVANDLNSVLESNNIDDDIDLSSHSPYLTFKQLPNYVSQINKDFSILTLNCQSINAKFDQIFILIDELQKKDNFRFTCILMQECFLPPTPPDGSPPDVSMYNLPGYNTFALGASCSSNGGLICYVLDSIKVTPKLEIKNSKHWEAIFLELNGIDSNPIVIGNIYRPPRYNNNNKSIENFITEFYPIISNISNDNKHIVLAGDYNIDVLQIGHRQKYADFLDHMISAGYLPKITHPTRFAKKSASLLDQIFIKSRNHSSVESFSGIIYSPISDHCSAFTSLPIKIPKESPKYIVVRE